MTTMLEQKTTSPTLRRYEVTTEHGTWLASFVIDADGYFSAVSSYGTYSYAWHSFTGDFRAFLAGMDAGYMVRALSRDNVFDGAATMKAILAAIAEMEPEAQAKEREHLTQSRDLDSHWGFAFWARDSKIEDAFRLGEFTYPREATLFGEKVWPRFVEMLRVELDAERAQPSRDSAVAIVQDGLVLVDAIVPDGDLFLSVSRKNDHNDMGCPGGKVKPGESLEDAVLREMAEESGYIGRIVRKVYSGPSTHGTCTAFLVKIVGRGERAPGETGRVAWVPAAELYAGSFGAFYREALRGLDPSASAQVWGHAENPDDESFDGAYSSRQEAVDEGRAAYEGGTAFWVLEGERPKAKQFLPSMHWFIDQMTEQAFENAGKEDWVISEEARAALQIVLESWATTWLDPVPFWTANGEPERIEPEVDGSRSEP